MENVGEILHAVLVTDATELALGEVAHGLNFLVETSVNPMDDRGETIVSEIQEKIAGWKALTPWDQTPSSCADAGGLGDIINKLRSGSVSDLSTDELKLILACHSLLFSKDSLSENERGCFNILNRNLTSMVEAAMEADIDSWVGPAQQVGEVTSEDLQKKARRSFKTVAGIKKPFSGKLFEASGSIVIKGDVPEDCIIITNRGTITVEGFVFGCVLGISDIQVTENINGMVVSKNGDIRCRKTLGEAYVVAKTGTVLVSEVISAEKIFGGRRVSISKLAEKANIISHRIVIGGTVRGCTLQTIGNIKVARATSEPYNETDIILRREIGPESYDESMLPESLPLRSDARTLGSERRRHNKFAASLTQEMDFTAYRNLVFLLGGDLFTEGLAKMEKLQQRFQFIECILAGMDSFCILVADKLSFAGMAGDEKDVITDAEADEVLQEVEKELKEVTERLGGITEEDLKSTRQQFREVCECIRTNLEGNDPDKVSNILDDIERRVGEFRQEGNVLDDSILEMTDSVNASGKLKSLQGNEGKYAELLTNLMNSRLTMTDEDIARRKDSGVARRMQKSLDICQKNLATHRNRIKQIDTEVTQVRKTLAIKYNCHIVDITKEDSTGAAVEGIFAAGVAIATSGDFIPSNRFSRSRRCLITTKHDKPRRFVRIDDGIAEKNIASSPLAAL